MSFPHCGFLTFGHLDYMCQDHKCTTQSKSRSKAIDSWNKKATNIATTKWWVSKIEIKVPRVKLIWSPVFFPMELKSEQIQLPKPPLFCYCLFLLHIRVLDLNWEECLSQIESFLSDDTYYYLARRLKGNSRSITKTILEFDHST